jgi:hypothetical protein
MINESIADYLQRVHWLPGTEVITDWHQAGIPHRFQGRGTMRYQGHATRQVHGCRLVVAGENTRSEAQDKPQADGLWTHELVCQIGIQTADCLPVLIYHPDQVMALHAGWRGLAAGILNDALTQLHSRGRIGPELRIALGPCISQAAFEVGPEVKQAFQESFAEHDLPSLGWAWTKGVHDRWHCDLAMIAVLWCRHWQLAPEQIWCVRSCTYQNAEQWHSYRREGTAAGRNWSWIARSGSPD